MVADPLQSARLALPGVTLAAAGVFGVQDQSLAAGLLGQRQVATTAAALTTPDEPSAAFRPWLATAIVVAVSEPSIHVLGWDHKIGATSELARFDRPNTTVAIDAYRDARRLTLTDQRTGYRLPLTATVSRFNGYASGARSVLAALASSASTAHAYPAV